MTSDTRKGQTSSANRHDALFRAILEDPTRASTLIREYLPADIRKLLSDAPPKLVDGTFVDEALRGSQSDRLFEVQLKTGNPAFIFCLLEHKSYPDPRTPLQLLPYGPSSCQAQYLNPKNRKSTQVFKGPAKRGE